MKKKQKTRVREARAKYSSAPGSLAKAIAEAETVEDFLPPPEELALKEETVKVTLNLSRRSVEFFKESSSRHGMPYQQMVRRVLDLYTERYG